jgi:hypothetical protein
VPKELARIELEAKASVAFANRFQHRHGFVVLLAANSATLLGAWLLHWSLLNVLVVVWCETVLVALKAILRIALTGPSPLRACLLMAPLAIPMAATLLVILALAGKPLDIAHAASQVARSLMQSWPGLLLSTCAHAIHFAISILHHDHRHVDATGFARLAAVHMVALFIVVTATGALFQHATPQLALTALWIAKAVADTASFLYQRHALNHPLPT